MTIGRVCFFLSYYNEYFMLQIISMYDADNANFDEP